MALAFPPIYLLDTHIPIDTLHELEEEIPTLTYDINEAKVVLGRVTTKRRAIFELRSRKLLTQEVTAAKQDHTDHAAKDKDTKYAVKRRRLDRSKEPEIITLDGAINSSTDSETEPAIEIEDKLIAKSRSMESTQSVDGISAPVQIMRSPVQNKSLSPVAITQLSNPAKAWGDTIKVLKVSWYTESIAAGHLLPLEDYLVYEGKILRSKENVAAEPTTTKIQKRPPSPSEILLRAQSDAPKTVSVPFSKSKYRAHRSSGSPVTVTRPPPLLRQSTSEIDNLPVIPQIPDYLHTTYSCQRPTPSTSPNDTFIDLLKKIRTIRNLNGDQIGVRAYSTSIAALAAYPHRLTSAQEVMGLPGCDKKIAFIYQEWKDTGHILEAEELDTNPRLKVLNLFYEIWGVGATTAREFYNKDWRDLDDVVEFGWRSLSRVQQIGLKYYDEFQTKIPRKEVEKIANQILISANKLHAGWQMVIVGGYRRGKEESGDVDVVISHPDEAVTSGFIQDLVEELEKDWIDHTLSLTMTNSERGQTPVSWKGEGMKRGHGFDTLDKALVVWQDPSWPSREQDLQKDLDAKNPNIHRRVDIIVSPWKTVGCAVAGWSSGTTFQRDLRRYAKNVRGLKFDSSGIRSREDGRWIDFESVGGSAPDMITAEKRVFEGLGLEWREPSERCTG